MTALEKHFDREMTRSIRLHGLLGRNVSKRNVEFVWKTFNNEEWDKFICELYCRRKFHHRLVISNTAVRVCKKVQKELDILLFPVAERLTTPYKDAGAWSWQMGCLEHPGYHGSSWSLAECGRRDKYLVLSTDYYIEIIPEEKEKKNV